MNNDTGYFSVINLPIGSQINVNCKIYGFPYQTHNLPHQKKRSPSSRHRIVSIKIWQLFLSCPQDFFQLWMVCTHFFKKKGLWAQTLVKVSLEQNLHQWLPIFHTQDQFKMPCSALSGMAKKYVPSAIHLRNITCPGMYLGKKISILVKYSHNGTNVILTNVWNTKEGVTSSAKVWMSRLQENVLSARFFDTCLFDGFWNFFLVIKCVIQFFNVSQLQKVNFCSL